MSDRKAGARVTDQSSQAAATPPAARPGAMIFILATVVLDMLSIGLIVPIMPRLVETYFSDVTSAAHAFGWSMTIWAFLQFFMSPILGALSDQYGRRP
ncbi:MAG: tetracycline resistance MFS efflux pump, partial [Hyphomonadaceae bacterium]